MKILIIINQAHYLSGWFYLSHKLKNLLYNLYNNCIIEIKKIEYNSWVRSSFYFYSYKNIELNDNYDLIFVCEGKPSPKWKNNGKIIWIPCQEFIHGSSWNLLINPIYNWFTVLCPSKLLYNKLKQINKNYSIIYCPIWNITNFDNFVKKENDFLTLFIHFRTRNWSQNFWKHLLNRLNHSINNIKYIIKIDNHSDTILDNINLDNVISIMSGQIKDQDKYLNLLKNSDIYFAPRLIEGIGLCSQEAASLKNVLIGPNYSTFNEYFNDKNGLLLNCKEYKNNNSTFFLGEYKTVTISEKQIPKIIDYINELNNNRDKLKEIQEYNFSYSKKCQNNFNKQFKEIIDNLYENNNINLYNNDTNVLHIQFCLEGGQGLISCNIASDLSKYYKIKNEFCYLSANENTVALNSYFERLNNYNIIHKKIQSINDIDKIEKYDCVFIHWCSVAPKVCDTNIIYQQIKNINKPTIGLIYDSVDIMPDICDYYCTASKFNLKFVPNFNKKVFIVPYQIEEYFYDRKIRKQNNFKYSSFVINRTSRLIERKFHRLSFPIIKYLINHYPEITVQILGDGCYQNEIEEQLTYFNIPYKLWNEQYNINRAKIIANSDLCLYLTSEHEESFGLAVAEHLALGIPVVCENKGALGEVVKDGGFYSNNFKEIIKECEKIITDINYRNKLSKNALRVSIEYHPKNVTKQYKDIIETIKSNNFPKWSIIIPVYNTGKYLKDCLNSVINQTYNDYEIIIIDDNSNDNSQDIILDYMKKYYNKIHYLRNDNGPNSQSYCWQKGLEKANGQYIGFVDSDDCLYNNALQEMTNYYNNNEDIIFSWSQNERWNESMDYVIEKGFSEEPSNFTDFIDGMLLSYPGIVASHFLTCKRSVLQKCGGFDTSIKTSADKWLALKMDLMGKIGFVDKILYKYRFLRPGSITVEKRELQIKTTEKILNDALKERKDSRRVKLYVKDDKFNYDIYVSDGNSFPQEQ